MDYQRFAEIPWTLSTNSTASQPRTLTRDVDFGDIRFLRLQFDGATDWSAPFWSSDRSWLLLETTGTLTGGSNVRVVQEDWTDGQGQTFSSLRPGRYFQLRQDGSRLWLDLTSPERRLLNVMQTGSDSGDGSLAAPFRTIDHAAQQALSETPS